MDEPDESIRGIVGARLVLALPECRFVFHGLISRWSNSLESMGLPSPGRPVVARNYFARFILHTPGFSARSPSWA